MRLEEFIGAGAREGLVPWLVESAAAAEFACTPREIEAEILRQSLRPERYARNFRSIDLEGQRRLHEARVAVVGCGGLGGYIVEELARVGVGTLVVVDPDRFEPSNLNRQILASVATLGRSKAEVASERVASINPAVLVLPRVARLGADNADELLSGCRAAADGLDSIPARRALGEACARLGIPLVHGAIAGWYVQATTVPPGGRGLSTLYGGVESDRGIEVELGNPAFTPAFAASIEVAEIVKILLGKEPSLADSLLHFDLSRMEAARIPLT